MPLLRCPDVTVRSRRLTWAVVLLLAVGVVIWGSLRAAVRASGLPTTTALALLTGVSWGPENTCPVCGQRSAFLAFGNPPRSRALCRNCFSLDRHRLLYLYLKERTNLFTDRLSVLHFSPERGLRAILSETPTLTYRTSWYEADRPADYHLDLTDLDLPDQGWDVVIAYHIFEHIPDDRKAMREMYRVLKPGGWAVLQVPVREGPSLEDPSVTTEDERTELFGQHDHVRYYGWQDFADRLSEAGFAVTIERFGREVSEALVGEYALNPNERIYVARKPPPAAPLQGVD